MLISGGQLRYCESQDERAARPRSDGHHCNREADGAIAAAGFPVTQVRRLEPQPRAIALPVSPHVIGSAVWGST